MNFKQSTKHKYNFPALSSYFDRALTFYPYRRNLGGVSSNKSKFAKSLTTFYKHMYNAKKKLKSYKQETFKYPAAKLAH